MLDRVHRPADAEIIRDEHRGQVNQIRGPRAIHLAIFDKGDHTFGKPLGELFGSVALDGFIKSCHRHDCRDIANSKRHVDFMHRQCAHRIVGREDKFRNFGFVANRRWIGEILGAFDAGFVLKGGEAFRCLVSSLVFDKRRLNDDALIGGVVRHITDFVEQAPVFHADARFLDGGFGFSLLPISLQQPVDAIFRRDIPAARNAIVPESGVSNIRWREQRGGEIKWR